VVVIVDSNIIFSALLHEESRIAETLFLSEHQFMAPQFAIVEVFKYKEKVIQFSKMPKEKVLHLLHLLLKRIQFINTDQLPLEDREQAYNLCQPVDPKDSPFLALTLSMSGKLWTGDKKLIQGLKEQGFQSFFSISS